MTLLTSDRVFFLTEALLVFSITKRSALAASKSEISTEGSLGMCLTFAWKTLDISSCLLSRRSDHWHNIKILFKNIRQHFYSFVTSKDWTVTCNLVRSNSLRILYSLCRFFCSLASTFHLSRFKGVLKAGLLNRSGWAVLMTSEI